ncbi:MAG: hypothetical protein ACYSUI_21465 [Planctomycetota bacterium]|jgi:hypothetical protein
MSAPEKIHRCSRYYPRQGAMLRHRVVLAEWEGGILSTHYEVELENGSLLYSEGSYHERQGHAAAQDFDERADSFERRYKDSLESDRREKLGPPDDEYPESNSVEYWLRLREGRPIRGPRFQVGDWVMCRGVNVRVLAVAWESGIRGCTPSFYRVCTAGYGAPDDHYSPESPTRDYVHHEQTAPGSHAWKEVARGPKEVA